MSYIVNIILITIYLRSLFKLIIVHCMIKSTLHSAKLREIIYYYNMLINKIIIQFIPTQNIIIIYVLKYKIYSQVATLLIQVFTLKLLNKSETTCAMYSISRGSVTLTILYNTTYQIAFELFFTSNIQLLYTNI